MFLTVIEPSGDEWAARSSIALLVAIPAKMTKRTMGKNIFIRWRMDSPSTAGKEA